MRRVVFVGIIGLVWAFTAECQEVGIGTTTPGARLNVDIPASYTLPIFEASKNGSPMVTITSDGRVGVGTSSPSGAVHVERKAFSVGYPFSYQLLGMAVTVADTSTTDTGVTLEVTRLLNVGNNTSNAQYYGILSTMTTQSGASGNYTPPGWMTSVHANALHYGSGTVGDMFGVAAVTAAMGVGGLVERAYGAKFTVAPYLGNITSAYGLRIEWPIFTLGVASRSVGVMIDNIGSLTGVARINLWTGATSTTIPAGEFNIYASGGRKSYFADKVGFGTTSPASRVHIQGDLSKKIVVTTTNHTAVNDHTIVLDGSNLTLTIDLPNVATGREYRIVSYGTGNVLNQSYIDFSGASTTALPSNGAIVIQSDGTNWRRVQ